MRYFSLFFGFLFLAAQVGAQNLPQEPAASYLPEFHLRSTVVLVPTLVRDAHEKPVYTLSANDFTLTDDGQPQTLHLQEETRSQPLALVLVLQTGGAASRHLDDLDHLATMLDSVVGDVPHRVELISFGSTPSIVQSFTSKTATVREAIEDLPAGDDGAALLDALHLAVEELRTQPADYRRVILLVSETLDHNSRIPFDEALRAVTETNTAIYSMAFSSTKARAGKESSEIFHNETPGPANGCMGHDPGTEAAHGKALAKQGWDCLNLLAPPLRAAQIALLAGISALRQNTAETVAQSSGGEYFRFKNAATLESDLTILSNHLPNRYLLSFQPQSPHPGLHHIEVKLRDYPQLTVLSRSGYWAEDAEATKSRP